MSEAAKKLLIELADATEELLDRLIQQDATHDFVPMALYERRSHVRELREALEKE